MGTVLIDLKMMKMTKTLRLILVLSVATAALSGCTTWFNETRVSSGPVDSESRMFNFDTLQGYSWQTPVEGGDQQNRQAGTAEVRAQIKTEIDSVLGARGYQPVTERPDFLIRMSLTAKDRTGVREYEARGGYAPGFVWRRDYGFQVSKPPTETQVEMLEYREGTLVLDIVNPLTGKIVWRGVGRKSLKGELGPMQRRLVISEVVGAVLANFPP